MRAVRLKAYKANQSGSIALLLPKSDAEALNINPGDWVDADLKRVVRDGEEGTIE